VYSTDVPASEAGGRSRLALLRIHLSTYKRTTPEAKVLGFSTTIRWPMKGSNLGLLLLEASYGSSFTGR
jgi:hypothetical protein